MFDKFWNIPYVSALDIVLEVTIKTSIVHQFMFFSSQPVSNPNCNPVQVNAPFQYPLEMSKSLSFSDVFRRY